MAIAVFQAEAPVMEPKGYAVGFDTETWDVYIYCNNSIVGMLTADAAGALRDQVLQTAKHQGKESR